MKQAFILQRLFDRVRRNRRDSLRVDLRTAVAAVATYAAIRALGLDEHLSWAVIAALFTISVRADSSVMQGLGRIAGAFLGVALGLGAGLIGAHVVVGLAIATAAANMVASVWPNLRYAAVTAAIVALDPTPDALGATVRAGAILLGTLVGVATTFVVWPRFGRERAAVTLRAALDDCETESKPDAEPDLDSLGCGMRRSGARSRRRCARPGDCERDDPHEEVELRRLRPFGPRVSEHRRADTR